jgi:hypothetical protein
MLSVMRIGDANSFVEFVFKEAVPEGVQGATDTSCSVEVSCNRFAGKVNSVWFGRSDIDRFLSDLQNFELVRKGSVSLVNMSSLSDDGPLDFEIFSVSSLGHLAVRATLRRITYVKELSPLTVSISFALDPGLLRQVLEDFRVFFACPPRHS